MSRNDQYHFKGQQADEKILLVLHRHWFDIFSQFIIIFLMLAVLFGSYALSSLFYGFFSEPAYQNLIAFVRSLFFIFIWITFFVIWIDYYLDVWIVTDKRIINIEQKGLFARVISELELSKIQDITIDVHGVNPTFLNYGDLFVQTAAEMERFQFRNISNPYSVKDLIMNRKLNSEAKKEHEFGEIIGKEISEEIK
jgi:hypothetical protein